MMTPSMLALLPKPPGIEAPALARLGQGGRGNACW